MRSVLNLMLLGTTAACLTGCLVDVKETRRSGHGRCESFSCEKVPVKVAYLVQERGDWTGENQITIEAHDSEADGEDPVASTDIVTRSAQGSGETTLYLEPGDYCIRGWARRRVATESSCRFDASGRDFVFSCSDGGNRYESRSFVQCISVESESVEREVRVDIEVED